MKSVRFHDEARAEIASEALFYKSVSNALAQRFIEAVEDAVTLAPEFPAMGTNYKYGTRRYFPRKFPFSVIYLERETEIFVVLILKTTGRVYGLDLGKDHHNPQCDQVGEKHKHKWTEQFRDKEAYEPYDITESASDPVAVWRQFCAEAHLTHEGTLHAPPPHQEDLFL